MQFVQLGEIPITKTKAYSIQKEMHTFLHSLLPKIYSDEKPSSFPGTKKPYKKKEKNKLSNKKTKKEYLSPRKRRQKSTSTRSKRRNDNSSENKSIPKCRKISSSHDNAISTHPVSEDQQQQDQQIKKNSHTLPPYQQQRQKSEQENPQKITQINQQLNQHLRQYPQEHHYPNHYPQQEQNYSNPNKYINKNPRRPIPFQPNHQYPQAQHNHLYQQQNNLQNVRFTQDIIKTFGHISKSPNSNTPILTLYRIPVILTPSENNRNQSYYNNSTQFSGHAQHNYINPNSEYMFRRPTGICQYQILNPQNIQTSILQHCKNSHKNNILTYKYPNITNEDWLYFSYPPNN